MKVVLLLCVFSCILYQVVNAANTCSPKPLQIPGLALGTTIYANDSISYISLTLEPNSAYNFNISFYTQRFPGDNITVYTSWGNNSCPDNTTNNMVSSGSKVLVSAYNPGVRTYYFGIQYAPGYNATNSVWVIAILNVGCPDYCRGQGALCNSQTGCECMNNWYNPQSGCNVTGVCDPFIPDTNPCTLPSFNGAGYGEQNCTFSDSSHSVWGQCNVAFCNPGYILDHQQNACTPNGTSSSSSSISSSSSSSTSSSSSSSSISSSSTSISSSSSNGTSTTTTTTGNHKKFVGPLSEAVFFGILGGGIALVIIIIIIAIVVTRRNRHHYHKINGHHH